MAELTVTHESTWTLGMMAIGQHMLNSPVRRGIPKSDQTPASPWEWLAEHLISHLPNDNESTS
jgi:hypothetical protein